MHINLIKASTMTHGVIMYLFSIKTRKSVPFETTAFEPFFGHGLMGEMQMSVAAFLIVTG
jgi:hypothetical protein